MSNEIKTPDQYVREDITKNIGSVLESLETLKENLSEVNGENLNEDMLAVYAQSVKNLADGLKNYILVAVILKMDSNSDSIT